MNYLTDDPRETRNNVSLLNRREINLIKDNFFVKDNKFYYKEGYGINEKIMRVFLYK